MIHIKRLQEDGADVIAIIGEIDASSSIELDLAIAKSVGEGYEKILVDCSALEYISSAGLGVFMSYIDEFKDKKNCYGPVWDERQGRQYLSDIGTG